MKQNGAPRDLALPAAFRLHRRALAALRPDASAQSLASAITVDLEISEAAFIAFLLDNGLGAFWHQALQDHAIADRISVTSRERLQWSRRSAATNYLLQTAAIEQIDRMFAREGVAYALIKGAHVRELVYADPALRSSCDIDILVSPRQRTAAIDALVASGFACCPEPQTISHEAVFTRAAINVDLHWHLLRPGRTRIDITDQLIERRCRRGAFWALDDTDAMFVMLAHPGFTKYICSPNMALSRVVDFMQWTQKRSIDWDGVAARLNETGLKTAAWTQLSWFAMLGVETPCAFMTTIKPGKARQAYLRYWLDRDLPTRWLRRWPLLVQLGLTLFLHDRVSDAGRALAGWARAYAARRRTRPAPLSP